MDRNLMLPELLRCGLFFCKLREVRFLSLKYSKYMTILTAATLPTLFVTYCNFVNGQRYAQNKFLNYIKV